MPATRHYSRGQRGSIGIRILIALIGVGLIAAGVAVLRSGGPSPGGVFVDVDQLPKTRLELSRDTKGEAQFCSAIGRRSMILGLEDATGIEGWDLPFQAFYDLHIRFEAHGQRLEPSKIVVRPEATFIYFGERPLLARAMLFAPVTGRGGCILLESLSASPLRLTLSFVPALKMMWPGDKERTETFLDWDPDLRAFVAESPKANRSAIIGGGGTPSISTDEDPPRRFRRPRRLPITDVTRCRLEYVLREEANQAVFAFAAGSDAQVPTEGFRSNVADLPGQFDSTASYYQDYLRGTTSFWVLGDAAGQRAFSWAKIALEKCFIEMPGVGSGYVAGFDRAGGGLRPGYAWFFARDAVWMSFAACCIGQFDKAKASLDLLAGYQIREGDQKGKIPHEIPAAGDPIYSAGDAAPLWVIGLYRYWEWTGDTDYLQRMWPQVVDAIDWCYRQDTDGDLLMDNPPAGHEWYDFGGRNMIDLEAIWCKALLSAASIAEVLSARVDSQNLAAAVTWAADAQKIAAALDERFWNEDGGYFNLRQETPGVFDDAKTANAAFALMWYLVSPHRADLQLRTWQRSDMMTGWGVRTLSNRDDDYNPEGYHDGRVWPYVNGLASLAAFAQGDGDFGYRLWKSNAQLVEDFALGWIPETLDGDDRRPMGAPFQGWSAAMVIQPVVEGLLGFEPQTTSITPVMPSGVDEAQVTMLRVPGQRWVRSVLIRKDAPPKLLPVK